jgi:hypothetical protein
MCGFGRKSESKEAMSNPIDVRYIDPCLRILILIRVVLPLFALLFTLDYNFKMNVQERRMICCPDVPD